MKRKERVEAQKLELQMTSMIDVVFLLLIFFIVTLQIPEDEAIIETSLPTAEGPGVATAQEELKEEFEDIILQIGVGTELDRKTGKPKVVKYIRGTLMIDDNTLYGYLKLFKGLNPDGRVVISCTDKVPYSALVNAISVAQAAELKIAFEGLGTKTD